MFLFVASLDRKRLGVRIPRKTSWTRGVFDEEASRKPSAPASLLTAKSGAGEEVKSLQRNCVEHERKKRNKEDVQMSNNLTAVLQALLQNTTNVTVLGQLMTPDATYVSLNFDNPELKTIMPWTGTHKGRQALPDVFAAMQRFWRTLDFKVVDTIEQGSRVAFFGSFTYKSIATGKEITSPFSLLARFEGEKVAYVQFLEDSYGTAGSFKIGGATRFHSDPSGKEVEV
jgi:ketosteroid isomerase-like protein